MYRTIDCATWDDPWFAELSPNGKLLFLYFITNRRTSAAGCFEITRRAMMFESNIRGEALDAALEEISSRVTWWPELQVVFVHNFYKHQRANSNKDNFRKSALKALVDFPAAVQATVRDAYPELCDDDGTHTQPIPIPSPSHGDKETVTETETEQESKDAPTPMRRSRKKPEVPVPEEFALAESTVEWCQRKGYERKPIEAEVEQFVAYHQSRQTFMSDWQAGFRNWILMGEKNGWARLKEARNLSIA